MSINVTGPVLSGILFEHSNSNCDKEGLLLGKVNNIITDTISDLRMNNIKQQTIYCLYSFIPFDSECRWYNGKGGVDVDAIMNLLHGHDARDVIGWYKLRRNSSLVVSLRERAIHRCLSEWIECVDSSRRLVFGLCVSHSSDNSALYTCQHQFMTYNGRSFDNLHVNIENLGSIAKPDYRSCHANSSGSSCYDNILNQSRSEFVDSVNELRGVSQVQTLRSSLHAALQGLCQDVTESESQLSKKLTGLHILQSQLAQIQGSADDDDNMDDDELIELKKEPKRPIMETAYIEPDLICMDDECVGSTAPHDINIPTGSSAHTSTGLHKADIETTVGHKADIVTTVGHKADIVTTVGHKADIGTNTDAAPFGFLNNITSDPAYRSPSEKAQSRSTRSMAHEPTRSMAHEPTRSMAHEPTRSMAREMSPDETKLSHPPSKLKKPNDTT